MPTTGNGATAMLPPVEHPLEDGWTLPASWYSSEVVYRLELERIFARSWQYVGRLDQLPETGSFFSSQVAHVPVVVVRDGSGELRGFVNV